jgi:hypothetical protein
MADYLTILENPPRPPLMTSMFRGARLIWAFLLSAVVALIGAVLQLMGKTISGRVFLALAGVVIVGMLLLGVGLFVTSWCRYIREIRSAFDGLRRKLLIHAEWQEDAPGPALRVPMRSIAIDETTGTLRVILDVADGVGIRVGSRLALILTATNEVWGILLVNSVLTNYAWAVPYDRRKPDFWQWLEERAIADPSPPTGFHLEADIPDFLRYEPVSTTKE